MSASFDLDEQRASLQAKVEELRHRIAVTLLDKGEADSAALSALEECERRLAAVDAAEGERVRRQRAVEAEEEQRRQIELKADLASAEASRLAAVELAQKATRVLHSALVKAREAAKELQDAMAAIGGVRPLALDPSELERRLTMRANTIFLDGKAVAEIGDWSGLRPLPNSKASDDWTAAEQKIGMAALNHFLKSEPPTETP